MTEIEKLKVQVSIYKKNRDPVLVHCTDSNDPKLIGKLQTVWDLDDFMKWMQS